MPRYNLPLVAGRVPADVGMKVTLQPVAAAPEQPAISTSTVVDGNPCKTTRLLGFSVTNFLVEGIGIGLRQFYHSDALGNHTVALNPSCFLLTVEFVGCLATADAPVQWSIISADPAITARLADALDDQSNIRPDAVTVIGNDAGTNSTLPDGATLTLQAAIGGTTYPIVLIVTRGAFATFWDTWQGYQINSVTGEVRFAPDYFTYQEFQDPDWHNQISVGSSAALLWWSTPTDFTVQVTQTAGPTLDFPLDALGCSRAWQLDRLTGVSYAGTAYEIQMLLDSAPVGPALTLTCET